MRLDLRTIFVDAGAIWRADRELLLGLSGFFFALPSLALSLFLAPPVIPADGTSSGSEVLFAFLMANIHWIALSRIAELFGVLTLFVLCLDPARPTLRGAMGQAVRALPMFLVLALLVGILVFGGLTLFIIPGFYLAGRTFVAGAAMAAERRGDPFGALFRGFALTQGHGWLLFSAWAMPWLVGQSIAMVAGSAAGPESGDLIVVLSSFAAAVASGAATLAISLAQIAAYRRLGGSISGT